MIKQGGIYQIDQDALELLPFTDIPPSEWKVAEVLNNSILIQRILADGTLEELLYEVTEEMLILPEQKI